MIGLDPILKLIACCDRCGKWVEQTEACPLCGRSVCRTCTPAGDAVHCTDCRDVLRLTDDLNGEGNDQAPTAATTPRLSYGAGR